MVCGLQTSGDVTCWGPDDETPPVYTKGDAVQVASGQRQACVVRSNGTAVCWDDEGKLTLDHRTGDIVQIAIHREDPCLLTESGNVTCIGGKNYRGGDAVQISVWDPDLRQACAVLEVGVTHCWAVDDDRPLEHGDPVPDDQDTVPLPPSILQVFLLGLAAAWHAEREAPRSREHG